MQIGSVDKALESIEFSPDAMRSFIGFSVEDTEVQSVFESLNFEVDTSSELAWQITPPTYRQDVSRPLTFMKNLFVFLERIKFLLMVFQRMGLMQSIILFISLTTP